MLKPNRPDESVDGLFGNKVLVIQARKGYRVSEDAIFLAWFARPGPRALVLDAGAGCGVIGFGLAMKDPLVTVVGLEIQDGLSSRAHRGAILNRLEERVSIVRGDLRHADRFFGRGVFDCVVCNPPYHEAGSGRISKEREKAVARHQVMMPVEDLFRVSMTILKPFGRLSLIFPASRMDKIEQAMKETGFGASRVLWIHPRQGAEPGLVCVEARPGGQTRPVEDTLIVFRAPGIRTPRAEAILGGEGIPSLIQGGDCVPA